MHGSQGAMVTVSLLQLRRLIREELRAQQRGCGAGNHRGSKIYYTMSEAAAALGWSVLRTRRRLVKWGAAVRRGGHWYTTKGLLRRALPEEAAEVIAEIEAARAERLA
jgi:hypothetical protein